MSPDRFAYAMQIFSNVQHMAVKYVISFVQERLNYLMNDSDLLKKVWTIDETWVMDLMTKPKPGHHNGNDQKIPKNPYFDKIWMFWLSFSSITILWCIMSSCYKIVRTRWIIIVKLCAASLNQYEETARICGKINHGCDLTIMLFGFGHRFHRTWYPATFCELKKSIKAIIKEIKGATLEVRPGKFIISESDCFEGDKIYINE